MIQMNKTIERIKKVILVLIIMLLGYGLFSMIINIKTTSKQYKINYDDKIYNEINVIKVPTISAHSRYSKSTNSFLFASSFSALSPLPF